MVCVYCGSDTKVINSRLQKRQNQVWRRRQCLDCQAVVTTLESLADSQSVMVQRGQNTSRLEPFSRDKLLISIYESCRHRQSALNDATALSATIVSKLLSSLDKGVLPLLSIQTVTYSVLSHFDNAAAVHYQAYYMH